MTLAKTKIPSPCWANPTPPKKNKAPVTSDVPRCVRPSAARHACGIRIAAATQRGAGSRVADRWREGGGPSLPRCPWVITIYTVYP